MMGLLSNLLGGSSAKVQDFKTKGAIVIDVRTAAEYREGHVKGSKNIPLQEIEHRKGELKKLNKPLILCCASGMRSGKATALLNSYGLECINGGSWTSVNKLYQ